MAELRLELIRPLDAGREDDECAHELAAALEIAHADDRARSDGLVRAERALGVVRAEALAAARDHVRAAPDEPEEAVLVHARDVAGDVPVAAERLLRLLGRLPVAREERRRAAAHGELALGVARQLVALVVDDGDLVAGEREPERAGA